jgi:hypothetical protein
VESVQVGAERVRGLRAGQARRVGAGLRAHTSFHDQLRAGRVAGAAMTPVDAAAVGAAQAGRDFGGFGCLQADDGLPLGLQCPVGQVFQQGGGRGGVCPGAGKDAAQVLDHVRAGPGGLSC